MPGRPAADYDKKISKGAEFPDIENDRVFRFFIYCGLDAKLCKFLAVFLLMFFLDLLHGVSEIWIVLLGVDMVMPKVLNNRKHYQCSSELFLFVSFFQGEMVYCIVGIFGAQACPRWQTCILEMYCS